MKGYQQRRPRRATPSFGSDTSRGSRLRRGCTALADAYIRLSQTHRQPRPMIRLEAAGYLGRADDAVSRGRQTPAGRRRAAVGVHVSRRGGPRRQARVSADARRAVGAGDLRRAERRVPARGDGERRAGRAAAPRRLHRDRREDRRRPAGRSGRSGGARRRRCSSCGRTAGRRPRSARADSRASARITASRIPPIDFSRCVPR